MVVLLPSPRLAILFLAYEFFKQYYHMNQSLDLEKRMAKPLALNGLLNHTNQVVALQRTKHPQEASFEDSRQEFIPEAR
jgi:hypothetical protein